ncbi:MAG TPA: hypothetical protein VHE79_15780, partial [Spirochaetia bacterium]
KAASIEEFKERTRGFGVQFYDFFNRRDDAPYLVHDGEETDTTLAPFYGLLEYDNEIYKNYTRFALTAANRLYCPLSRGIRWEECTDSTFPGYVTGAANVVDRETYDGENGYFNPIHNLTDLDGSLWWWPYKYQAQDDPEVQRMPGKCGWASGALIILIVHDWFGLHYDAPARVLSFSPLDFIQFDWNDIPIGNVRFTVSHHENEYTVVNRNTFSLQLNLRLFGETVRRSNGEMVNFTKHKYLGRKVVTASLLLLPGEELRCTVR